MWKSIINRNRILSEAPIEGEDFQLTQDDLGEDSNDYQTTEIPGADPASGQAAPADPNASGGDPNAAGGADVVNPMEEQDPNAMPPGSMMDPAMSQDPMPPSETETDRLKKLSLLNKYKELLEIIDQLKFAIECIDKIKKQHKDEEMEYLEKMIEKIETKIKDVITYRFLTEDYKELLRIFYYFKYSISSLSELLEQLTESDRREKEQNKNRNIRKINK